MIKQTRREKRRMRHRRIRAKMQGTMKKPRLVIFRSHKRMYVQLVDDQKGTILASSSGAQPNEVAKAIAEKTEALQIKNIVFDRGGYKYHGQVKVLAEELRAQGIKF